MFGITGIIFDRIKLLAVTVTAIDITPVILFLYMLYLAA
jgi:hypothetical protein